VVNLLLSLEISQKVLVTLPLFLGFEFAEQSFVVSSVLDRLGFLLGRSKFHHAGQQRH